MYILYKQCQRCPTNHFISPSCFHCAQNVRGCRVEGPVLHQLVIFFGAHFLILIIGIEIKLCKVIDDF